MGRPSTFALRYYAYRVTSAAGFTAPIWYLYLYANGLSYFEVAVVNAVWWSGLLLFELPTGYVGDRIGRRESLLLGTGTVTVATLAMIPASTLPAFAVVFAVWAAGQTFRSGADDAWLYDGLDKDDSDATFLHLRSRGTALALVTTGATALVGGWLAEANIEYTFLAAAIVSALGLPILWTFPASRDPDDETLGTFEALPVLREELGRPGVRSFVLLIGLFTGVHWGVNFFVQPVSVDLGVSRTGLGVLYAGFTGLGALGSYRAEWIAERIGIDTWFRAIPVGLAALLVAVAFLPALAIPAFVAIRTAKSTATPLAADWLNDRIGSVGRATVLSAQGMVATALTVPFELGAGSVAELLGPLSTVALFGAVLGSLTVGILALGRPFARSVGTDSSCSENPADGGGIAGRSG
ncbi:sugar transporter [Salinarchaeum sp. Harcht-Bsk1]|uniref:MFS transporter n=1 Tax=Salinarchaeum sp. Harcht-Bsk1 TaxID=1333523 RepID=UPI00034244FF|nr:MFS transporter [Salinarchaeum sp. Harcht-Bsk1]AGN00666.1 sugar transporter [Salinarchaeum sp. Harcht-Bsk1]